MIETAAVLVGKPFRTRTKTGLQYNSNTKCIISKFILWSIVLYRVIAHILLVLRRRKMLNLYQLSLPTLHD